MSEGAHSDGALAVAVELSEASELNAAVEAVFDDLLKPQ